MKKNLLNLFFVFAIVTFGFTSCSKKSDANAEQEYNVEEQSEEIPVEVATQEGDTVSVENDTVQVDEVDVTPAE